MKHKSIVKTIILMVITLLVTLPFVKDGEAASSVILAGGYYLSNGTIISLIVCILPVLLQFIAYADCFMEDLQCIEYIVTRKRGRQIWLFERTVRLCLSVVVYELILVILYSLYSYLQGVDIGLCILPSILLARCVTHFLYLFASNSLMIFYSRKAGMFISLLLGPIAILITQALGFSAEIIPLSYSFYLWTPNKIGIPAILVGIAYLAVALSLNRHDFVTDKEK